MHSKMNVYITNALNRIDTVPRISPCAHDIDCNCNHITL